MKKTLITALAAALLVSFGVSNVMAAGAGKEPPKRTWTTQGPFGKFDRAQLKRGWQVYSEVCAACHSINQIYYRNLVEIGFSDAEMKEIAAAAEIPAEPNEDGETHKDGERIMRPGKPFDKVKTPFPNDNAARAANGGALPPDLTLMVKARHGGADYVHALLAGYSNAPSGVEMQDGMSYNEYFPGAQLAMAAPLAEDGVEYADGTKATVSQMAEDVTAFLIWTAEPELEDRKRMGIKVLLFLIVLTGMLYAVKRKIWADLH
jgi:ubiquinol-cytochrome c reductase cytochrome c1 subunit